MVSGKVKAAIGFHRSPATPKQEDPRRSSSSPASCPKATSAASRSGGKPAAVFARSFGVYFPRSPAQVQPRPPDVAELVRLVEELRERESRLQTELLEFKILKETASIVPFLEQEIASRDGELDRAKEAIRKLEADNQELRKKLETLRSDNVDLLELEKQMHEKVTRFQDVERQRSCCQLESEESVSQSQRFQGLIDASTKSNLIKNARKSSAYSDSTSTEVLVRNQAPRIPKPPPPSSSSSSYSLSCVYSSSSTSDTASGPIKFTPSPPPPPPPPQGKRGTTAPPPPPPPPPPVARFPKPNAAAVRRVPEVVEFYHSLMRRDSRKEPASGSSDASGSASARDMIGEIENRSAHLLAIKTEVETQGDFIRFLIKKVENASFTDIEDLVAFVKWLDDELSFLVDERAVLKHFEWPEQKADSMREAAFGYCDLKQLEKAASSFHDDPRQPYPSALKKMLALFDKLDHAVDNLSRAREGTLRRYKSFLIPWEWMLETGIVNQMKLASVKLAMQYMKRVLSALESVVGGTEEEELMLQGVRFAFRVHQFAGGFDMETMRAFQELKEKAHSFRSHNQNRPLLGRASPLHFSAT